ncbi:conserved hypothetical protein [uncultured Gammaproteobacteria bacterium]
MELVKSSPKPSHGAVLASAANPDCRHDYLVRLNGTTGAQPMRVTVRYVPDRVIVVAGALTRYCELLDKAFASEEAVPEVLAITVLDDFNNQLVPRWVEITVTGHGHRVVIEDRQPNWDNPVLLARLWRL